MTASSPNVLVLLPLDERQRACLEAGAPNAHYTYVAAKPGAMLGKPSAEQVADADVIVGNVDPKMLAGAGSLRLLQLNSAGYDNYLAAGTVPASAALACATGAYGQAVSEHLFAMLLAMLKRLPGYHELQRAHEWGDLGPVRTLAGANVLVLGTGDIGSHFACLCAAMGTRVTEPTVTVARLRRASSAWSPWMSCRRPWARRTSWRRFCRARPKPAAWQTPASSRP